MTSIAVLESELSKKRVLNKAISLFLYPATLKSVGCYVIPSVQKFAFECPSVRQSALHFRSLS